MPNDAAPFPYKLISFLSRDRDGYVSFNYAKALGHHTFVIKHLDEVLSGARRLKSCKAAMIRASEFISRHREIDDEIDRQWSAHVDRGLARYERGRAVPSASEAAIAEVT